jgi:hypothetical protein
MARSLTVKHEEKTATSPLFTFFLLLAAGWMTLSALTASGTAEAEMPSPAALK